MFCLKSEAEKIQELSVISTEKKQGNFTLVFSLLKDNGLESKVLGFA